jgi:hypothetical protein
MERLLTLGWGEAPGLVIPRIADLDSRDGRSVGSLPATRRRDQCSLCRCPTPRCCRDPVLIADEQVAAHIGTLGVVQPRPFFG